MDSPPQAHIYSSGRDARAPGETLSGRLSDHVSSVQGKASLVS